MDRSLLKLLRLRTVGGLRRRLRAVTTPRGLALVAVAVALLFWCGPALSQAVGENTPETATTVHNNMPLVLFGMCLLNIALSSGSPIYFSPAEVNFLFSGPFTRRSLLMFKFSSYASGALLTATLVTIVMSRQASGFVGCFLLLVFMQLVSATAGLTIHSMSTKSLRWLMTLVGLIVLVLVFVTTANEGIGNGLLLAFQNSWIGLALLAPFSIFTKTFYAERLYPDLLLWGSLAVGINVLLLTLLIRLDANFLEIAASASHKRHMRWHQAKRSGMLWSNVPIARWHLPQPHRLGGIGPIAWRQVTTALRTAGRPLILCLAIAVIGGPILVAGTLGIPPSTRLGLILSGTILLLPKILAFDFRGDVDQLTYLKSLPLPPAVIVAGQLVTPVLLVTLIHLLMLGCAMPFVEASQRSVVLALAFFTIPLNLLLSGMDNLIFLLFPARMLPIGRLDFEFFGRTILDFFIKIIALTTSSFGAALVGSIAYGMTEGSFIAAFIVAWLFFNLTALLAMAAVTWAFRRFDCSAHMPT